MARESDKETVLNDMLPLHFSADSQTALRKLTVKELIQLAKELREFGMAEYRRGKGDQ